jgi:uncharacterized protein (TIGR02266 family)
VRNPLEKHHSKTTTPAERRAGSIPVPAQDRRRAPRYALSLAITMQGENNFYAGLSEDMSEGGVFIATHTALPIGTPVVLSFTLPDSDEPLSVYGTVQWLRGPEATVRWDSNFSAGPDSRRVMPGMGIKFHDMDPVALRAIRYFVQRRSPVFFDA